MIDKSLQICFIQYLISFRLLTCFSAVTYSSIACVFLWIHLDTEKNHIRITMCLGVASKKIIVLLHFKYHVMLKKMHNLANNFLTLTKIIILIWLEGFSKSDKSNHINNNFWYNKYNFKLINIISISSIIITFNYFDFIL